MTLKLLAGDWEVQGFTQLDKLLTLTHPGNSDIFARVTPLAAIVNGNALTGTNKHFNWSGGEYPNATIARQNFVVAVGHNVNQGSLVDSTDDGMRDAWESCWEASAGVYLFERHMAFIPRATPSQEVRYFSASYNRTTSYTTVTHAADEYVMFERSTGYDLWHWLNGGRILGIGGVFGGAPVMPVIQFGVNNYAPLKQFNAASTAMVGLPYIDNTDTTVLCTTNGKASISDYGTQGILTIKGTTNKAPLVQLNNAGGDVVLMTFIGFKMYLGMGGLPSAYTDLGLKAFAQLSLSSAGAAVLPSTGSINFSSTANVDTGTITKVLGPRKTGWAVATGTPTRTTFDTTTVTLPLLAERVKALIDDLHATAGHGLIGT